MTEFSVEGYRAVPGVPRIPGLAADLAANRRMLAMSPLRGAFLRGAILLADVAAALTAFLLAWALATLFRDAMGGTVPGLVAFATDRGPQLGFMLVLLLALFSFGGLYARMGSEAEEIRRILLAAGLLALVDAASQFLLKDHSSRFWFLFAWPLFALLAITLRTVVRGLPAMRRALTAHVVLAGGGIGAEDFAYQLRESQANPVQVTATLPLAALMDEAGAGQGKLAGRLCAEARRAGVPAGQIMLVLVPSAEEQPLLRPLCTRLESAGLPFSVALPQELIAPRGAALNRVTGLDLVLAEHRQTGAGITERALKRGIDILGAGIALLLLAPAMTGIALMLALEKGPVFFGQPRVGQNGSRFRCLKFRTMLPDAEARLRHMLATDPVARAEWDSHQKLARDPRITRTGAFLRRTSLDELPQLFNVLKGEMSLVGPRPIVAPEVPGYDADRRYSESPDFIWYTRCRPGITGLWQVSGRATTRHDERVRLDVWYARNWSVWLDISILLRTLRVVLLSRTAS